LSRPDPIKAARFKVLTAASITITVFWNITYSLVEKSYHFGRTCCFLSSIPIPGSRMENSIYFDDVGTHLPNNTA
jgi:hypothetical protein